MNVAAIRDDGALLVAKDDTPESLVVIVVGDEISPVMTRGAALARGTWNDGIDTDIPEQLRSRIAAVLNEESDGDDS